MLENILFLIVLIATLFADGNGTVNKCEKAFDVAFLLDCGSDVSDADWKSTLYLVANVTSRLSPSPHGTRVSQLWFARTSTVRRNLNNETASNSSRDDGGDDARPREDGRDLAAAIRHARRTIFDGPAVGDRPEVEDVVVVVLHGDSDDLAASTAEAERVKADGLRLVTVGVGTVPEMLRELRLIASDEDEARRLVIARASQQSIISGLVASAVCRHDTDLEVKDGDLRLTDGNSTSGRLEVFVHLEWVTVCAGEWTAESTRVACRQLGFPDGVSWYVQDERAPSVSRRRVGLGRAVCDGNETRLVDCRHDEWFTQHHSQRCPANHSRDVFLRCLCPHCSDYVTSETLRLADGNSMSGRVEVRSADRGWSWTPVCDQHWTAANTRVLCRQLKFADGAGTYEPSLNSSSSSSVDGGSNSPAVVALNVSCVGNETSLSQCRYTPSGAAVHCEQPIYVRCLCSACTHRFLLQTPGYLEAESNSDVVLRWIFNDNVSTETIEVWFESRKNRQLLAKMADGQRATTVRRGAEFYFRFQLVVSDDGGSVELRIANVTSSDLGIYSISLPSRKLFDSRAVLFVNDFARVPRQLHCKVGDNVTVTWDLTSLHHLRDVGVRYDMYIITPASGRLHVDYYYNRWLADNRRLSVISADPLMPNAVIDDVQSRDAGLYTLELRLFMRSTFYGVNYTYTFNTTLTVEGIDVGLDESSNLNNPYFLATVCLAVLLGLSVLSAIIYCYHYRSSHDTKPNTEGSITRRYITKRSRFHKSRQQVQEDDGVQITTICSTEQPPNDMHHEQSRESETEEYTYTEDTKYINQVDEACASEIVTTTATSVDQVGLQPAVRPPDHMWPRTTHFKLKTIIPKSRSPMHLPIPSQDDA